MKLLQKFLMSILWTTFSVYAYDFEADGIYYRITSASNLTCAVDNGETGHILTGENLYEGDIVIPPHVEYLNKTLTVTSVDDYAFYNCSQLKSITLPETLVKIGTSAFENCTDLVSISLPKSVLEVGYSIFKNCTNLENIQLPANLEYISSSMLYGCTSLKTIILPSSILEIASNAFTNCESLTSFIFPDKIELIGYGAFQGCKNISHIELPHNLITIGEYAFAGLTLINEISIPSSVEHVGSYAFNKCTGLKRITIDSSSKTLYFDKVRLKDICGTFYECPELSEVTLGREIQLYDTYFKTPRTIKTKIIFDECITSLLIMDNVNIWDLLWENCFSESLESLILGTYNFANQIRLNSYTKLKDLTLTTSIPPKCPWFNDRQYMDIRLTIPIGSLDSYKVTDGWKNFWNIEEADVASCTDVIIDNNPISIIPEKNSICILNKQRTSIARIFTIQGSLFKETLDSEIHDLPNGFYIICVEGQSFKVQI